MQAILTFLIAHKTWILGLMTLVFGYLQQDGSPVHVPAWLTMLSALITSGGAVHDGVVRYRLKKVNAKLVASTIGKCPCPGQPD
jgi:hypothetical protein